jgi:hypothetical protein
MTSKLTPLAITYFIISSLGLITAWTLNPLGLANGEDYLDKWFGSYLDWVLSTDLLVVALAIVVFMIVEARKLGMKRVWLYFLLSGITAIAFTFPLFMGFREMKKKELQIQ